jgi:hypothetical protein
VLNTRAMHSLHWPPVQAPRYKPERGEACHDSTARVQAHQGGPAAVVRPAGPGHLDQKALERRLDEGGAVSLD